MKSAVRPAARPAARALATGGALALLAAGTLAAGTVGGTAAAGFHPAHLHRSCHPHGSRLLAHDALACVYRRPSQGAPLGPTGVYAYSTRTGRTTTLMRASSGPRHAGLGRMVLAGAIVAFETVSFGVDSGSTALSVVDVATGRVLRSGIELGHYVDAGIIASQGLTALVAAPDGAVAWIVERRRRPAATEDVWVYAAGRTGPVAQLDEGADIVADSLTLGGRTLRWWHAGVHHTRELPR